MEQADLGLSVAILAGASLAVKAFQSFISQRAEKRFLAELGSERERFRSLLRELSKSENGKDLPSTEASVGATLGASTRSQTGEILAEMERITRKLSEQDRKAIMQGLGQPSERGRLAYIAKLLTELEMST